MVFSKKDIERARERNYLEQASKQLGREVKSLSEVEIIKPKEKYVSLGQRLVNINKRKR